MVKKNISILGAGAWGTSLALKALQANNNTTLWSYSATQVANIIKKRQHLGLPDIHIPEDLIVTNELSTVAKADIILIATPAQTVREVFTKITSQIKADSIVIICSKGIELSTSKLLSEVCQEIDKNHEEKIAVLSGPNFAQEVARDQYTITTVASHNLSTSHLIAGALSSNNFAIECSDDIIGVQIAGALKNIIAIGVGIAYGASIGENSKSALMAKGLQEMVTLGIAKGGKMQSFFSMAGVGDLFLCCNSQISRNMQLGYQIGQGVMPRTLLVEKNYLTEGVHSVKAILKLAKALNLSMPVCQAIHKILYDNLPLASIVRLLYNTINA